MACARLGAYTHEISKGAGVISFIAAISTCDKGRQWEQALTLLLKMRETDMTTDVVSRASR